MASSSSGSEAEPVPSPVSDFSAYQALLQKTVISSAKLAASLPPKGDLNFQRRLDRKAAKELDVCGARIMGLTNRLLGFIAESMPTGSSAQGRGRLFKTPEDFEERYHSIVVDAFDSLYEQIDSTLDEASGKKAPIAPSAPVIQPSKKGVTKRLDNNILHAADIPKPQLKFKRPADNFEDQWRHGLTLKPHALVPLNRNDPHPYKVEILAAANQSREIVTVSPTLPPPLEQTSFTWVESTSQLREMLEKLKSATAIAVDLEHHDRRTYRGIVCLMQISTRNQDFIVDTLALHDELEVLNDVFADPSILKVFHGAESDIKWLQRDFNLYVVNLFDTYHASVELSFERKSLAHLLSTYCQFNADKRYQKADWRIRPLPEEMRTYAQSDTHFLLYIYDRLLNDLIQASPQAYDNVVKKSASTALQVYKHEETSFERGHDLTRKWNKPLSGRALAVFDAVYQWRDQIARENDESLRYVLPNHFLLTLAERPPKEISTLLTLVQPTPPLLRSHASRLLETIQSSVATYSVQELRKAKERADFGAMDIDSGPFANVVRKDSDEEPELEADRESTTTTLFAKSEDEASLITSSSSFFGRVLSSDKQSEAQAFSDRYSDVVGRIYGSLVLTPFLPLPTSNEPTPTVTTDVPVPTEPEQIPFVPAEARQETGANLTYKSSSNVVREAVEDDIVDVKDTSRKSKARAKRQAEAVETSSSTSLALGAPVEFENGQGPDDESDAMDADVNAVPPVADDAKAERKRRKQESKRLKKDLKRKISGGEGIPMEHAYASAPNLLDAESEEAAGGSSQTKKPKLDKRERSKGGKGFQGGFPAPPRSQVAPKSGNFSMTARSSG